MFAYHYFAEFKCAAGTARMDGVITSDKKIVDYDGYTAMKREITKGTDIEGMPEKLSVCSLQLLHKF